MRIRQTILTSKGSLLISCSNWNSKVFCPTNLQVTEKIPVIYPIHATVLGEFRCYVKKFLVILYTQWKLKIRINQNIIYS